MNSEIDETLALRSNEILRDHQRRIYRRTDRLFAMLMVVQWVAAIVTAVWLSPYSWDGATRHVHPHVIMAVALGFAITSLPVLLAWRRPGQTVTRYTISVAQLLFSALLIQITGGRIETHFHVFTSLAILTAYRDWKVLIPATLVVATDHLVRGIWWPETVYGVLTASPWRTVEHAFWVVFEDFFLILTIRQSVAEMAAMSRHAARAERNHADVIIYSEQLADSVQKEREIIEGALDAVIQMDGEGNIISWNSHAERTFGWSAGEAVGQKVADLIIDPMFRAAERIGLSTCLENGNTTVLNKRLELDAVRRDGSPFPIEIAITPIGSGSRQQFCAFIRDITERRRNEEEMRLAKEQAETANRTKSEFLANMSHEIRTPLNGILGFTELLIRNADGGDEAERRDYVKTIRTSGKHLLELINDILDLSKIEAGQLQVEKTACSPHHLIAEVVSVLRARAQEKGISLDYRWDSEIPESIQSDPYRVRQLLMNLVGNAVKFTERGGVDIVARLGDVGADSRLELEVRDTGIGIMPQHFDDIFKPFVQADNSVTRKFGGTGLGLTITKNICESLGGGLTLKSELGRGSTFVATLPAGDLRDVPLGERPPVAGNGDIISSREGTANLNGLRVLLVDDGETNRKLIQLFLARQGATVVVAENGELGVAATMTHEFDVILMDMQMPVMDGYAATRKLRVSGFDKPIIALTAHAMLGDRKKCEEAGCSGYMTKPVNVDELIRVVQASVRRGHSEDPTDAADRSVGLGNPREVQSAQPIYSTLPTDDAEIRELVAEFAATVPERIEALEQALAVLDFDAISALAHALKGAGGTAGFACLTDASVRLEDLARDKNADELDGLIHELRSLHDRIIV